VGEAKVKNKLRAQILGTTSFCIYCGGTTRATTIDHIPPRALFELRRRPKGLEFPACEDCNSGSRTDDLIAAALSRAYPDPRTLPETQENRKLFKAAARDCPGLLEELKPTYRQSKIVRNQNYFPTGGGALNCRGPRLNEAIHRFAAKMGCALHFHLTGVPLSDNGAIAAWWLTNFQFLQGDLPQELIDMMGPPQTLRQGRWNVGEQFSYASLATKEGRSSAHFATFRLSFAICAFVSETPEDVYPPENVSHVTTHAPGWLKIPPNYLEYR